VGRRVGERVAGGPPGSPPSPEASWSTTSREMWAGVDCQCNRLIDRAGMHAQSVGSPSKGMHFWWHPPGASGSTIMRV